MLSDRIRQATLAYTRTLNERQLDDLETMLARDHAYLLFSRRGHRFFQEAIHIVKDERRQALREEEAGDARR